MNDDETMADPKNRAGDADFGEALVYDFAKFLTTISILVMGGILTISAAADPTDVKAFNVIAAVVAVAAAATLSVTTALGIAKARGTGQAGPANPSRNLVIVVNLLAIGLGMFLFMWADSLT